MWKQLEVHRAQLARELNRIEDVGGMKIQVVAGGTKADTLLVFWYEPPIKQR